MERKIVEKEATNEAYAEVNGADASVQKRFDDLQHAGAVDDELAKLKAELGM